MKQDDTFYAIDSRPFVPYTYICGVKYSILLIGHLTVHIQAVSKTVLALARGKGSHYQ